MSIFQFPLKKAFKWWWAFCKKHSIISLYYKEPSQNDNINDFKAEEEQSEKQDELQRHLAAWKRRSKHYQYPSVATTEYIRGLFLWIFCFVFLFFFCFCLHALICLLFLVFFAAHHMVSRIFLSFSLIFYSIRTSLVWIFIIVAFCVEK